MTHVHINGLFIGDDVVGAPAMEQVQRHKLYKKILSKQQSDLKKLDKKHKKVSVANYYNWHLQIIYHDHIQVLGTTLLNPRQFSNVLKSQETKQQTHNPQPKT